jgi:hypothetical protein
MCKRVMGNPRLAGENQSNAIKLGVPKADENNPGFSGLLAVRRQLKRTESLRTAQPGKPSRHCKTLPRILLVVVRPMCELSEKEARLETWPLVAHRWALQEAGPVRVNEGWAEISFRPPGPAPALAKNARTGHPLG